MITDLPDIEDSRKGKRKREGPSFFSRKARVSFPTPNVIPTAVGVTSGIIKNEIRDAVKNLAFKAIEKTFAAEKQGEMRQELQDSQALSVLASDYASLADSLPKPLALLLLVGQKYAKVALT